MRAFPCLLGDFYSIPNVAGFLHSDFANDSIGEMNKKDSQRKFHLRSTNGKTPCNKSIVHQQLVS